MPLLSEYRTEVREALREAGISCTLRRCREPDWLLSLPLMLCADLTSASAFLCSIRRMGWEDTEKNGWVLLRRDVHVHDIKDGENVSSDGETSAVLSLLRRHRGGPVPERKDIFALLKAQEEGGKALEAESARLHGKLAEMLRNKQPLPDLYPYLLLCAENEQSEAGR